MRGGGGTEGLRGPGAGSGPGRCLRRKRLHGGRGAAGSQPSGGAAGLRGAATATPRWERPSGAAALPVPPPPPSPSLSPSPSASLFIPAFPSRSSPRCYRPVPQCRAVPSPAAVRFPPPIPHLTFSFCLQSRSGAALPALHPARSAPGARGVKRFPAGPQQQEEEEEEGDLRPPSAAFSEYG